MYKTSKGDREEINYITRKNKSWGIVFLELMRKEKINISKLRDVFFKIKKYKKVLGKDFTPSWVMTLLANDGTNRDVIEKMNDEIDNLLDNHKYNQFIKSISNNKNKFLFTKRVRNKIKILLDNKVSTQELKESIRMYIKTTSDEKDLFITLIKLENNSLKWNKIDYLKKIKKSRSKIIEINENIINLEILNFEDCKVLGSKKWCISNNRVDFDKYKRNFQKQFIIYNFNKTVEDKSSMIGITIDINGIVTDAYLKDNSPIKNKKELSEKYKLEKTDVKIIKSKLNKFDNQVAFEHICELGVDSLFDEYLCKNKYKFPKSMFKKHTPIKAYSRLNHSFRIAAKNGHIKIVRKLIQLNHQNINPGARNNYAIRWASEKGDLTMVNYLLTLSGVNPSADSNYSLRIASEYGYLSIVKTLIEDGRSDPTDNDYYALRWAAKNGHIEVFDLLRSHPVVKENEKNDWLLSQIEKIKKGDL